jgi:ubiquinone/menaquinone biosynthesis C-methylase UbiE
MGDTDRYYRELAAAFVRGRLPELPRMADAETIEAGLSAGLRCHKFKRNQELPRVRRVLGILRGISPESLLDIGSGRGTFLWPLLSYLPHLIAVSVDTKLVRVRDVDAVRKGGINNLAAALMDGSRLGFCDNSFDVVAILEVLEHLRDPGQAAAEAIRVAKRFVIASVPSKEDDNPEHLHLFDRPRLESLFGSAASRRISFGYVPGHLIALVRV